jgi:hypothetical protein
MQATVIEVAMKCYICRRRCRCGPFVRTTSFFTDSILRLAEKTTEDCDLTSAILQTAPGYAGGILKVSQSDQMRNKRLPDGAVGLGFHDNHKITVQTKWVLPLAETKGVSRHGTFPSFLRCSVAPRY